MRSNEESSGFGEDLSNTYHAASPKKRRTTPTERRTVTLEAYRQRRGSTSTDSTSCRSTSTDQPSSSRMPPTSPEPEVPPEVRPEMERATSRSPGELELRIAAMRGLVERRRTLAGSEQPRRSLTVAPGSAKQLPETPASPDRIASPTGTENWRLERLSISPDHLLTISQPSTRDLPRLRTEVVIIPTHDTLSDPRTCQPHPLRGKSSKSTSTNTPRSSSSSRTRREDTRVMSPWRTSPDVELVEGDVVEAFCDIDLQSVERQSDDTSSELTCLAGRTCKCACHCRCQPCCRCRCTCRRN